MGVVYATVEDVVSSMDVNQSPRVNALVLNKLDGASRMVEAITHRRFYPEIKTVNFDYPNYSYAPSWLLRLGEDELISLTTLESGGVAITPPDVFLSRPDGRLEPPYSQVELSLDGDAAFGGGTTHQRNIELAGLYGYKDETSPGGSLVAGINSSVATVDIEPLNSTLTVGIGSLIKIDSERMIVTGRSAVDTTVNLGADLTAIKGDRSVSTGDGTAFAYGQVIIIGTERMRVTDIIGNTLAVDRAVDGTVLSTHTNGADIYALHRYTVERGALGTTAAAHDAAAQVNVTKYPGLVTELTIAEATVMLEQGGAGWARTVGSGDNLREASGAGLNDLRMQTYHALGRKARKVAV